jgi:hypothetical protein
MNVTRTFFQNPNSTHFDLERCSMLGRIWNTNFEKQYRRIWSRVLSKEYRPGSHNWYSRLLPKYREYVNNDPLHQSTTSSGRFVLRYSTTRNKVIDYSDSKTTPFQGAARGHNNSRHNFFSSFYPYRLPHNTHSRDNFLECVIIDESFLNSFVDRGG